MSSIIDIKKRLERHREELQRERQSVIQAEIPPPEERDVKDYVRSPEPKEYTRSSEPKEYARSPEPKEYARKSEATRDIGMDELLRDIKNKEQQHVEELKDEMENLDDLKDLLTQMIKEGEEHINMIDSKLNKYTR